MNDNIKLYCVIAREAVELMGGNRGKMMTQAGHAYVHALTDSMQRQDRSQVVSDYLGSGQSFKITLVVDTITELRDLHTKLNGKFGNALITDAGRTVFANPTTTCLGVGPLRDSEKPSELSKLRPFL